MGRKAKHIKLSKEEGIALEKGRKTGKTHTFRERCHYILLNDAGVRIEEIAKIYQTSRQVIGGWIKRYELGGIQGLETAKGKGRRPIVRINNETEVKHIEDLVEQTPQNLNQVLVKIKADLGKEMSKKTLQRILKKRIGVGNDVEK